MSIEQYMAMSQDERAEVLWARGTLIGKDFTTDFTSTLYFLDGILVEVTVSNKNFKVVEVTAIGHDPRLDKYLHKMTA